ncbi:MAG: uracil-DNA glycosylase [Deltaproteobacteria bacterium]|nr:uracil-DNA glycosylase [Deltaproteobacteria bacterium]
MPDRLYQECRSIISGSRAILEDLRSAGIDTVSTGVGMVSSAEPRAVDLDVTVNAAAAPIKSESLEHIQQELNSCQGCNLCQHRQKLVFGVGNPQARLVLVGEAPGAQEDRAGEPFVGEAGQLLDRILFAMKLRREDVYVCNVLKCRPPGNRDPERAEIDACETFLQRQLAAIAPEMILSLGRIATQALLKTDEAISKLRGRWQSYEGIPLMPTFHPAYLLRKPASKHMVWEDVKQVMHRLQSG